MAHVLLVHLLLCIEQLLVIGAWLFLADDGAEKDSSGSSEDEESECVCYLVSDWSTV